MWKDSLPLATIEVKLSSAPVLTALSAVDKFAGVDKASECLGFLLNRKQIYELFSCLSVITKYILLCLPDVFWKAEKN